MDELSELDRLLSDQLDEARLDSAGSFTIAGEKALEKLAAFQLPRENAWACKLVQSAVVGGAHSLSVRQTNGENVFVFEKPSLKWTLSQVEAAFYDPQVSSDLALDHFKRGLWPTAIKNKRPFRLALPGVSEILFWDGSKLRRRAAPPGPNLELAISNRNCLAGPLNIKAALDAGQVNTDLRKELREHCFTCPIPLTVAGQRLDSLLGCPMHGFSPISYPIRLALGPADLPELPVAQLTAGGYKPVNPGTSKLNNVYQPLAQVPPQVNLAVLVAVTMEPQSVGELPLRRPCAISWVRDGIVIKREQLDNHFRCVSLGLFVNAEGLAVDLTGFEPIKSPEMERRREIACRAACPSLRAMNFAGTGYIRGVLRRIYGIGAAITTFGAYLAFNAPDPIGAEIIASSGIVGSVLSTMLVGVSSEGMLERSLHTEFQEMKRTWLNRWASSNR
ncbi:hypothetical protein JST97_09540 [bacterium]|nr:hypothetical protein [bacterium]